MRTFLKSRTGGIYYTPVPDASQVRIEDVAHRLSNICRFGGATEPFFSVAQHSVEVSMLCAACADAWGVDRKSAAYHGLMHEGEEGYIGDVLGPVRRMLGEPMSQLSRLVTQRTNEAFGVDPRLTSDLIDWADEEMLISDAARWNVLGLIGTRSGLVAVSARYEVPAPYILRFREHSSWSPTDAQDRFLEEYHRLRLV